MNIISFFGAKDCVSWMDHFCAILVESVIWGCVPTSDLLQCHDLIIQISSWRRSIARNLSFRSAPPMAGSAHISAGGDPDRHPLIPSGERKTHGGEGAMYIRESRYLSLDYLDLIILFLGKSIWWILIHFHFQRNFLYCHLIIHGKDFSYMIMSGIQEN